jgi:hypothetical protein
MYRRTLARRRSLDPAASMPPQNPLTEMRQLASDIARFADELEASTDFDARVFRFWQAWLLRIAGDLEAQAGPGS